MAYDFKQIAGLVIVGLMVLLGLFVGFYIWIYPYFRNLKSNGQLKYAMIILGVGLLFCLLEIVSKGGISLFFGACIFAYGCYYIYDRGSISEFSYTTSSGKRSELHYISDDEEADDALDNYFTYGVAGKKTGNTRVVNGVTYEEIEDSFGGTYLASPGRDVLTEDSYDRYYDSDGRAFVNGHREPRFDRGSPDDDE